MLRKSLSLAAGVALAATMATTMMFVQSADARILRVRLMRPHLIPATLKPGYVGAPGYPYGPPGPIVPTLVDIPPAGSFFTPLGVVGYGTGVVTGVVGLGTSIIVPTNGGVFTGVPILSNIR